MFVFFFSAGRVFVCFVNAILSLAITLDFYQLISFIQDHLSELIQEHFPESSSVAEHDPLLFGDYKTSLQPELPRLYEDIQDYDAAKGLFDEVQCPHVL